MKNFIGIGCNFVALSIMYSICIMIFHRIQSFNEDNIEDLAKFHVSCIHGNRLNHIMFNEEWNDFFTQTLQRTISNVYSLAISLTNNTYVKFCVFVKIKKSIILNSPNTVSLCVEDCSFIECYRTDDSHGGVIYFEGGYNCVLHKICAFKCYGTTVSFRDGQFGYIKVTTGNNYKNVAHMLSICQCAPTAHDNREAALWLELGNVSVQNLNESNNKCSWYSGICINNPSISKISLSTIVNNQDSVSVCIGFWSNTHHITKCNIIGNKEVGNTYGTIYCYIGTTTFTDCIINNNIHPSNCMFVTLSSGKIIVQTSYLQSNMVTQGAITIQSTITTSLSIAIPHFDSDKCPAMLTIKKAQSYATQNSIQYDQDKLKIIILFASLLII